MYKIVLFPTQFFSKSLKSLLPIAFLLNSLFLIAQEKIILQQPYEVFDITKNLPKSSSATSGTLTNSSTGNISNLGTTSTAIDNGYNGRLLNDAGPVYTDAMGVVPTVSGELNVSAAGSLTYTIPIDVPPGVNNFQPNLSLVYSSDSGMGIAGYGWSLSGLSSITRGGKSFAVDGINQGVQYDNTDAWYLDGQRLVPESATLFRTQNYSQIKIEKTTTGFTISYPDGKKAEYVDFYATREAVYKNNNFVINKMTDAFGNTVTYQYLSPGDASKGE